MEQVQRPEGLFLLFGVIRYIPYIAIALLVIATAIWIVFAIKKFRWARITAIVITVLTVFFGSISIITLFFGGNMARGRIGPPQGIEEGFQPQKEAGKNYCS